MATFIQLTNASGKPILFNVEAIKEVHATSRSIKDENVHSGWRQIDNATVYTADGESGVAVAQTYATVSELIQRATMKEILS